MHVKCCTSHDQLSQETPPHGSRSWLGGVAARSAGLLTVLTCAVVTLLASSARAQDGLFAGAAAVDITPEDFPINMPGGFSRNLADRAHDPLFARALALSDAETSLLICVVDNLGSEAEALDEAKAQAAARTHVSVDKILICSTHTHSAPTINADSDDPHERAYRKKFIAGVAQALIAAHENRRPASVGYASHPLEDEVFNRRWYLKPGKMPVNPFGEMDQVKMNPSRSPGVLDRPAGPTDPDITILSVQDVDQKPLALLANYSLHYVGAIPARQVSADYFGEFARLMRVRLKGDPDFVAMMSNGTSGDINNIPFGTVRPPRAPFEQVRIVARKAADTAWFAHQSIDTHRRTITVDMVQESLHLKYRRPTAAQVTYAERVLGMPESEARQQMPARAVDYARRTLAARDRKEETVEAVLQVIRIGDLAICGIPFETLVEIGLELKQKSPFPKTMVIGLANARHGYLPTQRQHRLGGYETWLGTNHVQKDAADLIIDRLSSMLDELHARTK